MRRPYSRLAVFFLAAPTLQPLAVFLMYLVIRATGGIRLTASGPVLVQQPAAAGRVRASWQRRICNMSHVSAGLT